MSFGLKVVNLMKILVISHMYPSSFNSVAGIFVHKQVKALIEQGHEIKVISPVPFAPFPLNKIKKKWRAYANNPGYAVIDGVEVYYPRYLEFPNSYFFAHSGYFMYLGVRDIVKKIYDKWKFDIINSNVAIPDGYCAMLLNRNYNVPHVVTIHGQDFLYTLYKNKSCRTKLYTVLENVDKIITVSNRLKNVMKSEKFIDKIVAINNGIDPDDFSVIRSGVKTSGGKTVISVSNLIDTKGIDLNIKAIFELVKRYPDIKYNIIGEGPEKPALLKMVKNFGLENNVFFLGKPPHEETMKYVSSSDIFCLPSWQEGFGIVYIEAMALGKPVIAVKGEGIEDVIVDGKNGFLVEPKNVEDIVRAISFLIENPDKAREVGKTGQKSVMDGFTWSINATKTVDVYEELVR